MAEGRMLRDQSRYADAEQRLHSAVWLAETFGSLDSRYAVSLNAFTPLKSQEVRLGEACREHREPWAQFLERRFRGVCRRRQGRRFASRRVAAG
jgi:hypothetical protein